MFEAIILGILQGLTEFFPVSSTAHLVLLPKLMGWEGAVDTLGFDVALHGGTLLALLIVMREKIMEILLRERHLLLKIIIATVPAGVMGVLFEDTVSSHLRSPIFIAIMLILFGGYMYVSERKVGAGTLNSIGYSAALLIGVAQAVAIFPGVSRSGVTIATALFLGVKRDEAGRFSFLLSIPVIGGALLLEMLHINKAASIGEPDTIITGVIASFISGVFALRFLLWFLRRATLRPFVYYRLLLAVIIISVLIFTR